MTTRDLKPDMEEKKPFFMQYVYPYAIQVAITVIGFAIGSFILLRSLDYRLGRVEAAADDYVRKDVLAETLTPMKDNIRETRDDVKEIKGYLIKEKTSVKQTPSNIAQKSAPTPQAVPPASSVSYTYTQNIQEAPQPTPQPSQPAPSPLITLPIVGGIL